MRWLVERVPIGGRYLDLGGTGLSAIAACTHRPDIAVISAEINERMWPLLEIQSERHGFALLKDDFRRADGPFDLIYLDLCSNSADATSMDAVADASRMLSSGGALFVTITPHHELDKAVSMNRPVTVGALLTVTSGMGLAALMRYRNAHGQWVILALLHGRMRRVDFGRLNEDVTRRNWWISRGHGRGSYGFLFGSRSQRYRADPKNHDRLNEWARREAARKRLIHRDRMQLDPEYAERHRAKNRAYRARAKTDPVVRAQMTEYHRRWAEAHREHLNEYRREWYRNRKAAVQSTAAEALDQAA